MHLKTALQDPALAIGDEIICTVMVLACSGADLTKPRVKSSLFNPPLTSLQWLEVYATVNMSEMHFIGLKRLVELRGGLANLEMGFLADIIVT